jgi:chromosome segregation ATPase
MAKGQPILDRLRRLLYGQLVWPQIRPELERIHKLGELVGEMSARLAEADTLLAEKVAVTSERLDSLAAELSAYKGEINSAEATLRDQLSHIHSELGERAERLENASAERDGTMQKVTVELGRIASRLDVLGTLVGDTSARLSDTDTALAEKLAVLARDDSNA